MIIPAVSKSHEGFYKCQSSGKESPQSWLTVKSSKSGSSSFLVPLVSGLACLFLLIILLLLMMFFKKSKNLFTIRSQNSNQQQSGDENIYFSPGAGESRQMTLASIELDNIRQEESEEVNYASVQIKDFGKNRKKKKPEEETVYSDVKTKPDNDQLYAKVLKKKKKDADDSPLYASVSKFK
ncbi:hypothetical protein OJAV_G00180220 [Oryzias javanicus]|uniref:Ig-like domain-containing protein n=1 Tax=Oryzias javanicus TaxID=123683 RepID=A0A437CDF6_ORYJA|nr:hypothetical protein OJAV_G00180220 [Oryzias javanicus]